MKRISPQYHTVIPIVRSIAQKAPLTRKPPPPHLKRNSSHSVSNEEVNPDEEACNDMHAKPNEDQVSKNNCSTPNQGERLCEIWPREN